MDRLDVQKVSIESKKVPIRVEKVSIANQKVPIEVKSIDRGPKSIYRK
ncbi:MULTISPECIES: hypothetical protein [Bacillus]|nr:MULTISPECIES: hypothetical protein [Bacillus]